MSRIAEQFSKWLFEQGCIDRDDLELYQFAFESCIVKVTSVFLFLILGLILGDFPKFILVLVPFFTLRKYCGGYHAKKYLYCLGISTFLISISLLSAKYMKTDIFLNVLLVLASVSLYKNTPVVSDQRPLSLNEVYVFRRKGIIRLFLLILIYSLLCVSQLDSLAIRIAIGIILVSVLQLPCWLLKTTK